MARARGSGTGAIVAAKYVANLRAAAAAAALASASGITLMIKPINGRDMPGYFLQRQDQAHALLDELGYAG